MSRRRKRSYKNVKITIPLDDYIVLREVLSSKGYPSVTEWVREIVEKEISRIKEELQPTGWIKLDLDPLVFVDKLSEIFSKKCVKICGQSLPLTIVAKDYSEEENLASRFCNILLSVIKDVFASFGLENQVYGYKCYPEPHVASLATLVFYIDEYPYTVSLETKTMFNEEMRLQMEIKGLRVSGELILSFWRKKLYEILVRRLTKWNPKFEGENIVFDIADDQLSEFENGIIEALKVFGEVLGSNVLNVESNIGPSSVKFQADYVRNNIFYNIAVEGDKEEITPSKYRIYLKISA